MPPKKGTRGKGKGKGKQKAEVVEEDVSMHEEEPQPEEMERNIPERDQGSEEIVTATAEDNGDGVVHKSALSLQERAAKMATLRQKMRDSATANRRDLIEESQKAKLTAKEQIRLERQQKLAEVLREKVDARETGEDLERKRNWEYSIEDNDAWTKKLEKKARNADFQFHDETTTAHRKYKKDLDLLKPDLIAYNRQKEIALGLEPGTLVKAGPNGQYQLTQRALSSAPGSGALTPNAGSGSELLYRDANTLLYADNKPSEEAIDRVVNKLNTDLDKRGKWSRKRPNEDQGDITYINERNKVFNKKIARFYDKYTTEIRASFERGTAV